MAERTIRARTGQTSDPLPEGKKVAEPQCVPSQFKQFTL